MNECLATGGNWVDEICCNGRLDNGTWSNHDEQRRPGRARTLCKTSNFESPVEQAQKQSFKSPSSFHCSSIPHLRPISVVRSLVLPFPPSLDFCRLRIRVGPPPHIRMQFFAVSPCT